MFEYLATAMAMASFCFKIIPQKVIRIFHFRNQVSSLLWVTIMSNFTASYVLYPCMTIIQLQENSDNSITCLFVISECSVLGHH